MKKLILLIAIIFSAHTAFAQECKKTCKKNTAVAMADLTKAIMYHDNGEVAQTGFYNRENKLHGEWMSFDTEGNKTAVAYYNNGKKTGTWLFYTGNDIKEVTYMDSKISKVKTWKDSKVQIVSN